MKRDEARGSLGNLVYDAQRFLYYHRVMIAKYPLQIYIAGLLFSPIESITKEALPA